MKKLSLLLVAVAALLVCAGCSDGPKDAAAKWAKAIAAGDAKTANEYSTAKTAMMNGLLVGMMADENKAETKEMKESLKKFIDALKDAKEEINGDTAKIIIEDDAITLKKVDGKWKVDVDKK